VPVIAWVWSNNTREAIQYTQEVARVWADALLSVVPYYNKPNQEWLYRHFRTQAESTSLPIVLYSIPGRSWAGIEVSISALLRLAHDCPNIIGIKEAGGNLERFVQIRRALDAAGFENFLVLSGDDGLTIPAIENQSADGVISVASNIIPWAISQMVRSALNGNLDEARQNHEFYQDFFEWLFLSGEPNPQATKYILSRMSRWRNRFYNTLRLPLIPVWWQSEESLNAVMTRYDIAV
jgi:4-hydroxy-tetrahydrodipicolinate synthase